MEDPKSLESPTTPTTEQFIQTQLHERFQLASTSEDSDDNQSVITVCPNTSDYEKLILKPSDVSDYSNVNLFVKQNVGVSDKPNLQTIVEVVNPILGGDGTAQEIAIGRSNDCSFPSFDEQLLLRREEEEDEDEEGGEEVTEVCIRKKYYVCGGESINDKMKQVLKELKQDERVRLSLSRSIDETEDGEQIEGIEPLDQHDGVEYPTEESQYEEKKGANGTVFMVRERLINDFYTHQPEEQIETEQKSISHNFYKENIDFVDNCQIYKNPNVDDFLENEIKFSAENSSLPPTIEKTVEITETITTSSSSSMTLSTSQIEIHERKEQLTLNLVAAEDEENDDDDPTHDDNTQDSLTPTTPTKSLIPTNNNKRKKRKGKNKKK